MNDAERGGAALDDPGLPALRHLPAAGQVRVLISCVCGRTTDYTMEDPGGRPVPFTCAGCYVSYRLDVRDAR